ncbi:MAG: UPF0175 family protein [Thermomicrobiales bacterium]
MNLIVRIPDDLAERLGADAVTLERRALEALAAEEYRAGRLTKPELRRMLGFATRVALDAFFNTHGIDEAITLEELDRQVRDLERLGF